MYYFSKEVKGYIEYIRFEFGRFNYAKSHATFDPAKIDDHLKQMITNQDKTNAETSSDSNGNSEESTSNAHHENDAKSKSSAMGSNDANIDSEMGKTNSEKIPRKRAVRSSTFNPPSAKKSRDRIDFSKGNDLVAQWSQIFNQHFDDKDEKIDKLQKDLHNTISERDDLKRKNTKLFDEKKELEEERKVLMKKIGTLESDLCKEKKKFGDEKKTFEKEKEVLNQKNATLEMDIENEKKKSDDKRRALAEALELNTSKMLDIVMQS